AVRTHSRGRGLEQLLPLRPQPRCAGAGPRPLAGLCPHQAFIAGVSSAGLVPGGGGAIQQPTGPGAGRRSGPGDAESAVGGGDTSLVGGLARLPDPRPDLHAPAVFSARVAWSGARPGHLLGLDPRLVRLSSRLRRPLAVLEPAVGRFESQNLAATAL